jgi:hypothetical protein
MKKYNFKALALLAGLAVFQTSQANDNATHVFDVATTQQELAAIYVLSEICPTLIENPNGFNAGYRKLAAEYLPNEKNPVSSLKQLSQKPDFKNILDEALQDAKNAGDAKNLQICNELSVYSN